MARSSSERVLRDHVVSKLRVLLPGARIVHELNVAGTGSNRIDVAAITHQSVVGVEIKSEKDTLKRLEEQWVAFRKCCHFVLVAAHEKHFAEWRNDSRRADVPSDIHLNHPLFLGKHQFEKHVWRFPELPKPRFAYRQFDPFRDVRIQPRARDLLRLLWREELLAECRRHGVAASGRSTIDSMVSEMASVMTGREIAEAVCRQLRARRFAEADEPTLIEDAALDL